METEPGEKKHLFTNKQLWALLVPVVVEQILNSLMGTADTMMVSNVGSAAISAVSLVDSINVLVIQVFAALAAGGTIICSQYMGQKNTKNATDAAKQLIFIITAIAVVLTVVCVVFQIPLLHLIFGKVEAEVMINSEIYFLYTALSFPFIAVFNAGSSVFRAQENTRLPDHLSDLQYYEYCGKCDSDFRFPYGSGRCGTVHTDFKNFLCDRCHVFSA